MNRRLRWEGGGIGAAESSTPLPSTCDAVTSRVAASPWLTLCSRTVSAVAAWAYSARRLVSLARWVCDLGRAVSMPICWLIDVMC